MVNKLSECEIQASKSLMEIQELKSKLMGACDMDKNENTKKAYEDREVPLVAYEMQLERNLEEKQALLDRHDKEKDKMRKQYRTIIGWLAGVTIALLIGVFGTVIWFLYNCDITGVTQDGDGLNNYAYSTEQGDVIYEPANTVDHAEKTKEG